VSRYFRDAKVMEIIEGSTQLQQELIAGATIQTHAGAAGSRSGVRQMTH